MRRDILILIGILFNKTKSFIKGFNKTKSFIKGFNKTNKEKTLQFLDELYESTFQYDS
jgi:hypothetical protein